MIQNKSIETKHICGLVWTNKIQALTSQQRSKTN